LTASELPEFLQKLEAFDAYPQTKLAIRFLILTFVRTGEMPGGKWLEIDVSKADGVSLQKG